MCSVKLPTPRSKRKHADRSKPSFPFPDVFSSSSFKCFIGVLKPDCVEINGFPDELCKRGFFGKKVSIREENVEGSGSSLLMEDNTKDMLILTFEEAFFLCYALGCLVVKDKDNMLNIEQLWQHLVELNNSKDEQTPFPVLYAAYHHFRTKGWVVKPGIQFGVHFVLYKDGPPYYHASYAVRVLCGTHCSPVPSWPLLAAVNRATINAGKNVLLCYVLLPEILKDFSLPTCIKSFQIQEMFVNRWVAAAERSD